MAKLTPEQLNDSHGWLHDVFVWGGLLQNPFRDLQLPDYRYMYGRKNDRIGQQAAKILCEIIKFRPVDYKKFQGADQALSILSGYWFIPDLHEKSYYGTRVHKKAEILAKYIANLCAERKYYLDDSSAATFEMDQIKQTILGKALWDFKCFISQQKQQTSTGSTSGNRTVTPRQPGQAPQNGYKSSGPQSQNMKCIVGQANQKLQAQSSISYCIEADKIGKNTPNAFIKPLDAKACPNGTAVVYMGSGNGYTDCKCWFDDKQIAVNFLNQCIAKFGNNFTNIHISQSKSDNNGYFIAKTEFGDCGIKASKMNEELQEAVEESQVKQPKIILTKSMVVEDADAFEKAMYR